MEGIEPGDLFAPEDRSPSTCGQAALEARWLNLTRHALPEASGRDWPVRFDHCFQRILLDNAVGGVWYDTIRRRPAYRHAPDAVLSEAIRLGEAVLEGRADLNALNRASLGWRGKHGPVPRVRPAPGASPSRRRTSPG